MTDLDHATAEPTGEPDAPQPQSAGRHWALHGAALGGGLLVAFSMPPWGWWPLSIVGIMLYALTVTGEVPGRTRFVRGLLFGVGWMYVGMAWMNQLTLPGYLVAPLLLAALHGLAAVLGGNGPWAWMRRPVTHSLAEALRFSFPFGGVPLASLGIAQVGGPLAGLARLGGVILLTWLTFQIGFSLAALVWWLRHRPASDVATTSAPRAAAVGLATMVVLLVVAVLAPRGTPTGETLEVAAVQGGGEQGTSALEVPSSLVTERHLEATRTIGPGVDFVLWPENTIDVISFAHSAIREEIAEEAARLGVPIAVGVTEDSADGSSFLNAQIVVTPDGEEHSRYVKVRRVPFGEYVPMRGVLEALGAPIDQIGRDATAGTGPAYIDLPDGTRLATVISWEVFFGGRTRDGVREGGEAILNPTNGASYSGTIVQTQQVASSRLRAIETGRWVVQAAPTGFTAIVDHEGNVRQRTAVSERAVLYDSVELRSGLTWYTRLGDAPFILLLLAALGCLAWLDHSAGKSGRRDRDEELPPIDT